MFVVLGTRYASCGLQKCAAARMAATGTRMAKGWLNGKAFAGKIG
jgi:hypothetical protein